MMTFTERRAQLSEPLGTPLSPGYRSVAFVSGTRRRTIPPLATQHDTSLEGVGWGGRTRGSRPTADGTLTEKTSKRRGDGRAACKASRGGGGGGGERAEGAERERGFRAPPPPPSPPPLPSPATTTVAATAERDVRFHI